MPQAADVIEMYLSLLGVPLLIPIFLFDDNPSPWKLFTTRENQCGTFSYILLQCLLIFCARSWLSYLSKTQTLYFLYIASALALFANICFWEEIEIQAFPFTN